MHGYTCCALNFACYRISNNLEMLHGVNFLVLDRSEELGFYDHLLNQISHLFLSFHVKA